MADAIKKWLSDWGAGVVLVTAVISAIATVLLFFITRRYVKLTFKLLQAQLEPQLDFWLQDGVSTLGVKNTGTQPIVDLRLATQWFRFFSSKKTEVAQRAVGAHPSEWTCDRLEPQETRQISLEQVARTEILTGENHRRYVAEQLATSTGNIFGTDDVQLSHGVSLELTYHREVDHKAFSKRLRFALGPGPDGVPYFMDIEFSTTGKSSSFEEFLAADQSVRR